MFGFLGPNGAGKTTAVKLLLGLTRTTGGDGTVLGHPLGDREARRRIGYLPELFRYQAVAHGPRGPRSSTRRSRGCPRTAGAPRSTGCWRWSAWRTALPTGPAASRRACSSGSGWRPRSSASPTLVILDEPTSALDPVGRDDVRAIIRHARERGSAVLLNSHLLGEVERLCDRVAIVQHGRVVAAGTLGDLLGEPSVRIRATDLPADRTPLLAFGPVTEEDGWLTIRPVDPDRIPDVVAAVVGLGGRVHAVDPVAGARWRTCSWTSCVRHRAPPGRRCVE